MPLNMKLMINATKRIRLEGTVGTGEDDPRKQRVSEETNSRGSVRATQVEGEYGGGVGCALAVLRALL
jgi:hypothetical protein